MTQLVIELRRMDWHFGPGCESTPLGGMLASARRHMPSLCRVLAPTDLGWKLALQSRDRREYSDRAVLYHVILHRPCPPAADVDSRTF